MWLSLGGFQETAGTAIAASGSVSDAASDAAGDRRDVHAVASSESEGPGPDSSSRCGYRSWYDAPLAQPTCLSDARCWQLQVLNPNGTRQRDNLLRFAELEMALCTVNHEVYGWNPLLQ